MVKLHPILNVHFDITINVLLQSFVFTFVQDKSIQLKAIYSLNDVLYKQLKFQGNKEDYYNLSNSYINEVLTIKTIRNSFLNKAV